MKKISNKSMIQNYRKKVKKMKNHLYKMKNNYQKLVSKILLKKWSIFGINLKMKLKKQLTDNIQINQKTKINQFQFIYM